MTLLAICAYAVLEGLPFGASGEHAATSGLLLGAGEPIDLYGAMSMLAELASAMSHGLDMNPGELGAREARGIMGRAEGVPSRGQCG